MTPGDGKILDVFVRKHDANARHHTESIRDVADRTGGNVERRNLRGLPLIDLPIALDVAALLVTIRVSRSVLCASTVS